MNILIVLLLSVLIIILLGNLYQQRAIGQSDSEDALAGATFSNFLRSIAGKAVNSLKYGGSYVLIFKIANVIIAIGVGTLAGAIMNSAWGQVITQGDTGAGDFLAVIVAIIWWYIFNLLIKLFENISIIARNSSDTVDIARRIEKELQQRQ